MNKVKTRALSVLLLVLFAILGLGFYVIRFIVYGGEWASAPFNTSVYRGGVLTTGVLTDRNGVVLADVIEGRRTFAESRDVRRATLHTVGDMEGNIGTGAMRVYAQKLMGYNFITGSYSRTGEGRNVALTIDSRLNVEAMKALDGRRGVVMVSNYETGEILCMVSSPTFDPGSPPDNVDTPAYEGVYLNRALSSAYTPGSTFKLVTAAAAIERIDDVYERVFECTGALSTGHGTVTCPRVHGEVGFEQGMAVSCNIVYGSLALELGADVLATYAEKLGLSGRMSVGGVITARGNFDKAEPDTADLAWSGVGQFNNTVCPAAMLRFVSAIANDGSAVDMFLLRRTGLRSLFPARADRIMSRSLATQLGEIIEIQNRQNFPGLELHAKSGTAQVGGGKEPHAWYTGYITNEDFPLAFVVIVENGGGGTAVAGPIANRILQAAIKP
jgi:peptidoglycan glycosyltransferase